MNFFPRLKSNTFNLLSIGQRGVGKTVFLAGSYAESKLMQSTEKDSQQLWFNCDDPQTQENLEAILNYVERSGKYPPATMRITDFHFSAKTRGFWGQKTICHFRWWDLPGEECKITNPNFQKIVLNSHACCVFINAYQLINESNYLNLLEDNLQEVIGIAIASQVPKENLDYPFALILTQCDRLDSGMATGFKLEQKLTPLIERLQNIQVKYQKFHSAVPIISENNLLRLKPEGVIAPLAWLLQQLEKNYRFEAPQSLEIRLKYQANNIPESATTTHNYIKILLLGSLGLVGISAGIFFIFHRFTSTPQPPQNSPYKQYELR